MRFFLHLLGKDNIILNSCMCFQRKSTIKNISICPAPLCLIFASFSLDRMLKIILNLSKTFSGNLYSVQEISALSFGDK